MSREGTRTNEREQQEWLPSHPTCRVIYLSKASKCQHAIFESDKSWQQIKLRVFFVTFVTTSDSPELGRKRS